MWRRCILFLWFSQDLIMNICLFLQFGPSTVMHRIFHLCRRRLVSAVNIYEICTVLISRTVSLATTKTWTVSYHLTACAYRLYDGLWCRQKRVYYCVCYLSLPRHPENWYQESTTTLTVRGHINDILFTIVDCHQISLHHEARYHV